MPTNKCLIIAPAWVGDMIMSQPLYQILQQQDYSLDLLAPSSTFPLALRMPQIKQAIELPIKHGELKLSARYHIAKTLRQNNYQQAVVLPNTLKSALIPWFAKIKHRIGWLGEQRYFILNDIRHDPQQYPSLLQRYAALAFAKDQIPTRLPSPKLQIDQDNLSRCLSTLNLSIEQPILAICPGAEFGSAKRWPAKYYAEIAQQYLAKQWQVWIFGTDKVQAEANFIQQHTQSKCKNLCGKTQLIDAIDLLSVCQLALSNDSGLMHMAAAVDVPIVAIYGSTSPSYTPPASTKAKILQLGYPCIPCFKRECPLTGEQHLQCLMQLKPEIVLNAMNELMP